MSVVDCRGLACPKPVMMTKRTLDQLGEGDLIVIVDNAFSCNNVERFVQSQGCSVEVESRGPDFYLHIHKGERRDVGELLQKEKEAEKVVVYINSNLLGVGDEALGSILMRTFLKTLLDLETKPVRLILINSGVKLASEGSEVLETLRGLSDKGVEILACGTCIDFYGLKAKMRVGRVSNMYDIAQSLLEADRLIRP
jgi:selenium metabolism protein YedF